MIDENAADKAWKELGRFPSTAYELKDFIKSYEAAKTEQPDESPVTLEQVWPGGEAEVQAFKAGSSPPDIEHLIRAYTGCTFGESATLEAVLRPYLRQPAREIVDRYAVLQLFNEIECRIEHGAESGGHLQYVSAALHRILNDIEGDQP